jgi:hypothetical protein
MSPDLKASFMGAASVSLRPAISEVRPARASGFDCVARIGFASHSPTSFAVSCEAGSPVFGSRQLIRSCVQVGAPGGLRKRCAIMNVGAGFIPARS